MRYRVSEGTGMPVPNKSMSSEEHDEWKKAYSEWVKSLPPIPSHGVLAGPVYTCKDCGTQHGTLFRHVCPVDDFPPE